MYLVALANRPPKPYITSECFPGLIGALFKLLHPSTVSPFTFSLKHYRCLPIYHVLHLSEPKAQASMKKELLQHPQQYHS